MCMCRQAAVRYLALCTEDDPLRRLPRSVYVDSCHEYLVHRITCQILQDEWRKHLQQTTSTSSTTNSMLSNFLDFYVYQIKAQICRIVTLTREFQSLPLCLVTSPVNIIDQRNLFSFLFENIYGNVLPKTYTNHKIK